ncbi:MAG: MFS transporter [Planctomycetota bacterium]
MTFLATATAAQRRTLAAAALGWMLDSFDVMLFTMMLEPVMTALGDRGLGGLIGTLTLIASGLGGLWFGAIADRIGRTRALMLSILTYSVCTFLCSFAQNVWQLAVLRFVLGLGMGGEWNTGATLVAETWPAAHRAKALGVVQSSWAVGYALAAGVSGLVLHYTTSWRLVFAIGVLPALLTLWVRRQVPESALFEQRRSAPAVPISELLSSRYLRSTLGLLAMNTAAMFAWWGLFFWIPTYLVKPIGEHGRGLSSMTATQFLIVLNLVGMLPGYIAFGFVADRIGRRPTLLLYFFGATAAVLWYAAQHSTLGLLLLGPLVAFLGTGFFSGSGLVASELFPTTVRSRALGLTYNVARMISALAPYTIGAAGAKHGLDWAFTICAGAYLLAGLAVLLLPETRGRELG